MKNAPAFPQGFDFEFVKFRDGVYNFQHEIDHTFFDAFEGSEVNRAAVEVKAEIDRRLNMIQVDLDITGTVGMDCHRCLETIDFPVNLTHRLIFELVPEHSRPAGDDGVDDILELVRVEHTANSINYARQVYELSVLAVPMIRNCDGLDVKPCNTEILQKLNELNVKEENTLDPRWDKLKDLFNK